MTKLAVRAAADGRPGPSFPAAQDKAMAALDEEMRAFKKIAKVPLKDAPQLLEKLGIPVRTTRTEAQRHAGAKAAATRKARAKKEEPQPVGA